MNKYLSSSLRTLSVVCCLLSAICASAQQALTDITRDITLSASNYVCYRGAAAPAPTAAPKGYKPCYISSYARHGSRWLIQPDQYASAWRKMHRADSLALLTPRGCEVLEVLDQMMTVSDGRLGELTDIGAEQHRGIGARMASRWPEIFKDGGFIEARSTPVIRCIFSMENELWSLKQAFPTLDVHNDGSYADIWYLNCQDSKRRRHFLTDEQWRAGQQVARQFDIQHADELRAINDRLALALFTDTAKVKTQANVNIASLRDQLFDIAGNMQSHAFATRGHHAVPNPVIEARYDLYDLFTPADAYLLWKRANWGWYVYYGHNPVCGAEAPFSQTYLLRSFIAAADSCLATQQQRGHKPRNVATLRFGHEVCVLPLACLMELGSCGYRATSPDDLAEHWRNYEIFTMASNIQLVFFRSKKTEAPILVKALLNERETTIADLPQTTPGFYEWEKIKAFWEAKLTGK